MFVDWALTPLIRIPVYPIPAPASDVVTTEGKKFNKIGKSWPRFFKDNSVLEILEWLNGAEYLTRIDSTITSSKFCLVPCRVSNIFSWENKLKDIINDKKYMEFFIFKFVIKNRIYFV